MAETILLLMCSLASIAWLYWLSKIRSAPLIVSFDTGAASLSAPERQLVLTELIRQQKWAFSLVWFAVALGIGLGGFLLSRAIFGTKFTSADLAGIVATVGDISVAGSAFHLYKMSGKRLQNLLEHVPEEMNQEANAAKAVK